MAKKREIMIDRLEFLTTRNAQNSVLNGGVRYFRIKIYPLDFEPPQMRLQMLGSPFAIPAGAIWAIRCGDSELRFKKRDYGRARAKAIAAFIERGIHPDDQS